MRKFDTHWDKLRLFYHIAKAGSFNSAADIFNVSQSALSRSIQILEDHLKLKLFERLPTGIELTRQGEVVFQSIERIIVELDTTLTTIEEEENEPTGSLRVAATSGFAANYLSRIIPELLRQYPRLRLSIVGNDILPDLHSDEADATISPFIKDDQFLIQTYLTTFHLKLYASQEYLDQWGTPQSPADLDHHRLLSYGDHKTAHPFSEANWHLTLGLKKGMIREPYVMINSATGLFNLALNGAGIASISKEHPALKESQLVEILPHLQGPTIDAYFVYSVRHKKIKRMEVLKQFLLNKFSKPLQEEQQENGIRGKR